MHIPDARFHDAPINLGPPSRIFREYWRNWGIEYSTKEEEEQVLQHGVKHFGREYAATPDRMPSISAGAEAAFRRDYPQLLNDSNARLVSQVILNSSSKLKLLEFGTGSGNTIKSLYREVCRTASQDEWKKIELTLVEPSSELLRTTARELEARGIPNNPIPVFAHQLPEHVPLESQDAIFEVASNHYPDPSLSFKAAWQALKPGGIFVLNEWCYSVTEYPERFRAILEQIDWPQKQEDMASFDSVFRVGRHRQIREPESKSIQTANRRFIEFYVAHVKEGIPYQTFCLKGHCPLDKNVEYLRRSGFIIPTASQGRSTKHLNLIENPIEILPDCQLLVTIVAKKPDRGHHYE